MKQFYFTLTAIFLFSNLWSQLQEPHELGARSQINPALYPFYHGVASGDPLADRVILWTRITLDPVVDPVSVGWQISTDTSFNTIINSGSTTTDSTKDYTVKVDAGSLQPNTWYYYRFTYSTYKSLTGRTKTLPVGAINNLRFAVASCQDYQDGFYNAHRHLSERNDIDAVLFLGDYTYEGGALTTPLADRIHEPDHKTILQVDYRMRQSQYHLDPDLQAHQQYPWICVWDDHETANNSYTNGAKNHGVNDGSWYDRKVAAIKTYHEWLPVRVPDAADTFRIFRQFNFGNLASVNVIDTRLYSRSKQVAPSPPAQFVSVYDTLILDSTRTMVGPEQFDWLENNLDTSNAKWQILAQQVILAPLVIPANVLGPTPVMINPDQWDGYPFDQKRLFNYLKDNDVQNMVVLTGDIHTAWANDLPVDSSYDAQHRDKSLGVEFVTPSISSGNELPQLVTESTIYSLASFVRYVELTLHGYYVLDITPARTQADFVYVSTVVSQNYTVSNGPFWYTNDGDSYLHEANGASSPLNAYPVLAPHTSLSTGITKPTANITTIMVRPNPFTDQVVVQFNAAVAEEITLEVFDANGRQMLVQKPGKADQGLNYISFSAGHFPSGFYHIRLSGKTASKSESVIKIN